MGLAVVAATLAASVLAAPAHAAIPASLYSPSACDSDAGTAGTQPITPHAGYTYFFCDDGVPDFGGLTPNLTGAKAITVPAKYGGDGFTGLPVSAGAPTDPGADASGHIALDADISLPGGPPPAGGYPLIVMMHGCCSGSKKSWESTTFDAPGEGWHYNNAWYAARGYAVLNYTARGFVNNQSHGSTGETQLDSRSYEINDFQSLACQVYANAANGNFAAAVGHAVTINPAKVVVTGGSYGGGFAWLALTDPKWTCNADSGAAGTDMSLAAAAPRYGWTDLAYTLVPTGTQSESPGALPSFNGCDSGPRDLNGAACPAPQTPAGIPKATILGALYFSGINAGGDHTTFAPAISEAILCLQGPYPDETNPACNNTLNTILPEFMRERSAYYQNGWFAHLTANDPGYEVPIFNAGTFSDTLFPAYEDRRMANRILATVPSYPIKQYYGDYEHFTQNKAKEWGDTCGSDHHVCSAADDGGDVNADPPNLVNRGATTRLNRFIDHYATPAGGYTGGPASDTAPDVTASLQACADNAASLGVAPNEPGPTFTASSFEALAPHTLSAEMPGIQTTTSTVAANLHAIDAEPVGNFLAHGGACPVENPPSVAGAGVASYSSTPLAGPETMIGSAKLTVDFSTIPALPQGFQLDSRLYDVFPSGRAVLVDRGPRRVTDQEIAAGHVTYELHGNGWRFAAGHQIRVEITQDDEPWLKSSSIPSSATLTRAHLDIPVVEADASVGGGPDPKPVPNPPAAIACGNRISGTAKRDRLTGTAAGDSISGFKGNDRIDGKGGADCINGGPGNDKLIGGPGLDQINGGSGKDRIKARDGEADTINCGRGKDKATIDKFDKVKSCEKVKRPSGRK